jgi:thiosulfate dehydrogenase [quinone] large subunit
MRYSNEQLSYLLARITLGVSMLGHGLVRLPKIPAFRSWMVNLYQGVLPPPLVGAFATVLPFIELLIGLFLVIGLFTRKTLVAGAILIIILIFGSCMKENWDAVGTQLLYGLFFYILIRHYTANVLSITS